MQSISSACLREFCDVNSHFFQLTFKIYIMRPFQLQRILQGFLIQVRREKGVMMDGVVSCPDLFKRPVHWSPVFQLLWGLAAHNCSFLQRNTGSQCILGSIYLSSVLFCLMPDLQLSWFLIPVCLWQQSPDSMTSGCKINFTRFPLSLLGS